MKGCSPLVQINSDALLDDKKILIIRDTKRYDACAAATTAERENAGI